MADATVTDAPVTDAPAEASTEESATELGDAGEKALKAERQARRAAERALKDAQTQLETLARESMSETEKAIAKARDEGKAEALSLSGDRMLKAEIKAAAAGKLADPSDAVAYLRDAGELARFLDADGDIDSASLAAAIDALVEAKPYLSPASAPAPVGAGEGGPRGVPPLPLNGDPLERELRRKLGMS